MNVKCSIGVHIHYPSSTIRLQILTTLSYVYSNVTHIIFSQTQWCMLSDATRAMNFGCMYAEHCMTSQLKDCKVPKTQLTLRPTQKNAEEICLPPREKVQNQSLSAHH